MNELSKQVEKVSKIAKNRTTKQVINDLMQMFCNLITEPAFIEVAFPNTLYRYQAGFRQELSYYKTDLPAWNELQTLSQMFMQAIKKSEPFTDVIGQLYDLELVGNTMGQFLTPPDVADTLASLTAPLMGEITEPLTIGDMTGCGAGTLVLSQVKGILHTQGRGAVRFLDVRALDLDMNMAKMATVQIVLSACIHRIQIRSLIVHQGNAITDYTAVNEGKKSIFEWMPNAPLAFYCKVYQAKKEIAEITGKLQELELI